MARFTELFTDFSKGDWGGLGAYQAGRFEDGFFQGMNVWVDDDGAITPRRGFKTFTPTGLPAGQIVSAYQVQDPAATFSGGPIGFDTSPILLAIDTEAGAGEVPSGVWVVSGDTPSVAVKVGNLPLATTLAEPATMWAEATTWGGTTVVYLAHGDAGVARIRIGGSQDVTPTFVPTGFEILSVARHGDRMYAAGGTAGTAKAARVWYSGAADFNAWDETTGWLDVGYQGRPLALVSMRNALWVLRSNGEHYRLAGTPGSSLTATAGNRTVNMVPGSIVHSAETDVVEYVADGESGRPGVFLPSGTSNDENSRHMSRWMLGLRLSGAHQASEGVLAFAHNGAGPVEVPADTRLLLRRRGAWTRHYATGIDIGYPYAPMVASRFTNRTVGGHLVVCGDGNSDSVHLYRMDLVFDPRPTVHDNRAADVHMSDGDGDGPLVDAWFHTPVKEHPAGHELRVMSVDVEFESFQPDDWDTVQTCHMDVAVKVWHTSPDRATGGASEGATTSQAMAFDEPMADQPNESLSGVGPTPRRVRFNVGDGGWGRGYQILVENMRGVRVKSISVDVDSAPRNSR